MCDAIFFLFHSQTQGADKSHKPNLCLPLLSFKLMICRRLHFPPKQDIVCLSSRTFFRLQHKLDWRSDSFINPVDSSVNMRSGNWNELFCWKNRAILTNPDGVLHQNSDHMKTMNGLISDSTCGIISDRSNPGDMLIVKQESVKVRPMGDLHLPQPVVKQINFPSFKPVNGQTRAIR